MPFPNEHSARLKSPDLFDKSTFRRTSGGTIYGKIKVPSTVGIIWAKLKAHNKPEDKPQPQALRFRKSSWSVEAVKKWLASHNLKPIRFEPAGKVNAMDKFPSDVFLSGSANIEAKENSVPSISIVAYTGGKLDLPEHFKYPVVIDLKGMGVQKKSIPFFQDHNRKIILGHSISIENDGRRVVANGLLSGGDVERINEIVNASKNGFPWESSVGAKIEKVILIPTGKTINVNGQSFNGPFYLVTSCVLKEISLTAIGADQGGTSVAIAASGHNIEVLDMEFNEWLEAKGFDFDSLDDKQKANLKAIYEVEVKASDSDNTDDDKDDDKDVKSKDIKASDKFDVTDDLKSFRDDYKKELTRVKDIGKICANDLDLQIRAIDEGWSPEKAELELFRTSRKDGPKNSREGGSISNQPKVVEAALCLANNVGGSGSDSLLEQWYPEKVLEAADHPSMRSYGLHALMHDVVRSSGEYLRPGWIDDEAIRIASRADKKIIEAAGYSTVSLTGILGAVANKSLLESFLAVDTVSRRVASEDSVNNFHTHTRYRMTGKGDVEKVGASGELKHGEFSEESYTQRIDTYGKIVGLNRQQIINDDMGAFLKIPRMLGRKCALALEKAFFTMVLGNASSFFAAANSNYQAGTATALSIAALTSAEQLFLDQTDADGDPVVITPAILLVPTALKVTAQELMKAVRVNETTTADTPSPDINPHAGKWGIECSPYLSNANLTGYSSTGWYLLANPADIACWEIAYLKGKKTPTIESSDVDFNQLGQQWRCYWDFGVTQAEHRGGVFSYGASDE